jgi:hypothetical protein
MAHLTAHRVLRQRLCLRAYKLQVVQAITTDESSRKEFTVAMLAKLGEDNEFLRKIMFSDEATFHISGKVNKQNVRIWGS